MRSRNRIAMEALLRSVRHDPTVPLTLLAAFGMEQAIRRQHDGRTRYFDPTMFPWVSKLEAHTHEIQRELDGILLAGKNLPRFQDVHEVMTASHEWRTYVFQLNDRVNEVAVRSCPRTWELIRSIPGHRTAMFSIFPPGTELPPHRGPYRGVLRYHLGLRVPGECGIKVDGEERAWHEGKSLVFDDSFVHTAWNRSSRDRVVLFVDFLRPMPRVLGRINRALVRRIGQSRVVQDAFENVLRLHTPFG